VCSVVGLHLFTQWPVESLRITATWCELFMLNRIRISSRCRSFTETVMNSQIPDLTD
jgi:hypothetical protein